MKLFVSSLLVGVGAFVVAQTPPATPPATPPPATSQVAPTTPASPPVKTIADLTKDFEKIPGTITLYRKKSDTADTIYAELSPENLNRMMLLQVTNSGGTQGTSAEAAPGLVTIDLPLEFRKLDDTRLLLVEPRTKLRTSRPERKKLIDRSFPEGIIQTFPIMGKSADGKNLLINLSAFLKSDVADLGLALGPGYGITSEPSYIDSLKNLPANISYRVNHYMTRRSPAGGPKAFYLPVSYSWSFLPDTGYRPRLGDPRVGFFTTYFQTSDNDATWDPGVNYILRWDLKKRDPKSALSEPVKPITFWIDNATPPEFRGDIKKALLMWNPAFERIGIKNAIVVKQMPDDADWDIADVRYNVVRWTVDMTFAIALFRTNPITGEIINANINMDAGFATGGGQDFDFNFDGLTAHQIRDKFRPKMAAHKDDHDGRFCNRVEAGRSSLELGISANELVKAGGMPRKEFIRQYIVEVVAHEMGHILGLRHNFAATNSLTAKQLADPQIVKTQGVSASVMDYNASNLFAIGKPGVDVYSQTVGVYDNWAIEYGYSDVKAATPEGERFALAKIARKSGMPGLRYESDGTANGIDPSVQTFDLAQNNLDYFEKTLQTSVAVMRSAVVRGSAPGQSYYSIGRRFQVGFNGFLNGAFGPLSIVGGVKLGNSFQGDPAGHLPAVPYSVADQRRAIAMISKYVLSPNSLPITPEILTRISFNPNADGNEASGRAPSLLDSAMSVQSLCVALLLDPFVFRQVANNEFRTSPGADRITADEIVVSVVNATMKDLIKGTPTDAIGRNTQRATVADLIFLLRTGTPSVGDARLSARTQLKRIQALIAKRKGSVDSAHYADISGTINRYFKQVAITLGD